jgi:hypothetical protein
MDGGIPKQIEQGEILMEVSHQLTLHPHYQQGMSANIKEVIVETDAIEVEDLLPKGGDRLFEFGLGQDSRWRFLR